MSESIKAGDLVAVVRTCCAAKFSAHGGKIFVAALTPNAMTCCRECGHEHVGQHFGKGNNAPGCPSWWLKRIPPIEELDNVKREEEITA